MTRLLTSLSLIVALSLAAAGCNGDGRSGGMSTGQAQTPSVGGPGPGGPGGPGQPPITVRQLTGDDDSEVSAELQANVAKAFPLGETDTPVEF